MIQTHLLDHLKSFTRIYLNSNRLCNIYACKSVFLSLSIWYTFFIFIFFVFHRCHCQCVHANKKGFTNSLPCHWIIGDSEDDLLTFFVHLNLYHYYVCSLGMYNLDNINLPHKKGEREKESEIIHGERERKREGKKSLSLILRIMINFSLLCKY